MLDSSLLNSSETFRYQLLSRLQMDCDYYLNCANKSSRVLWSGDEKEQIENMFQLHESFSEDKKPEWLTIEQIKEYESKMINK